MGKLGVHFTPTRGVMLHFGFQNQKVLFLHSFLMIFEGPWDFVLTKIKN